MIETVGLAHINLNVGNIGRAMRFYQEVFGLELLTDYRGPMGTHPYGRQVILSTPGARDVVALSQIEGEPIGPAGVNHFGFNLMRDEDVDAAIAAVENAGGKLIKRQEYVANGITEHNAYVTDPDGYVIS